MTATPEVVRFSRVEVMVHAVVGLLVVVLMATAAALYLNPIAVMVGHRRIVATVHVWCGLALPVPVLLGLASVAFRLDLRRLNRFAPADRRWLRSRRARASNRGVGKFNAGQKLNTALSAGALLVLLGTGVLMYWPSLVRLDYRAGATFVHDLVGFALGLLVLGHVYKALQDREALRGARTGRVSAAWARRHHPDWADELSPTREDVGGRKT
ncbi:cytochrome b/b6 domain-containing protein [Jatrophihabitans sp. YIM 134969]